MHRSLVIGLAFAGLVVAYSSAAAQDQSRPRWERPGFDISRDGGWRVKARRVAAERRRMLGRRDFRGLNAPAFAGPAAAAQVMGTIQVPMVLFYYRDSTPGNTRPVADYAQLLFGTTPPAGRPYTLRTYYDSLSNGVFWMEGQVKGWVLLDSNEVTYTGQPGSCPGDPYCNGLNSVDARRRMQNGLREALAKSDTGVTGIDFRLFDNDGPDNVPNSGDDDGFVDMMGFAHATLGGECVSNGGGNHIWSHRYVLANFDQSDYQYYFSNDPSAEGGTIKVRDYFIQSGLGGADACTASQIMPIGIAAHEFGHALGLPDLYDTFGPTEGIGRWGLMGAGSYSVPNSPARMEAWSLNELGWVTVVPITMSGTYTFGPAPTADTTFLVTPLGSNPRGEYFLLENRQAVSADTGLIQDACEIWFYPNPPQPPCSGGLLIWHVDSLQVVNSGFTSFNTVNVGSVHGVKLEEADGVRDLWCAGVGTSVCNRGDLGDPYPGKTGNTAFTFESNPSARKNSDGAPLGFRVDQIVQLTPNGEMSFRVTLAFPLPTALMGADYTTTLVAGGVGPYTWTVAGGALPGGLTLSPSGVLSGVPTATGTFAFAASAASVGPTETYEYSISVVAPVLTVGMVLPRLFDPAAATLTFDQLRYLDLLGNNNGGFDVGDFKAWVDATGAPVTAPPARAPRGGRP